MNKTVFVVLNSYNNDGNYESGIIGVFSTEDKAKEAMRQDIAQLKKDWSHIDFDNPEDWEADDSETCYDGFTPCDDYSYSISIKELPLQ